MKPAKNKSIPPFFKLLLESVQVTLKNLHKFILIYTPPLLVSVYLNKMLLWQDSPEGFAAEVQRDPIRFVSTFIGLFLLASLLTFISSIAALIAVRDREKQFNIWNIVKESLSFAFPILVISIVYVFLTFGSFWLLIFPWIFFIIWFGFYKEASVYGKKKWIDSLRYSKYVTSTNFEKVFVYVLFLGLILVFLNIGFFIVSVAISEKYPTIYLIINFSSVYYVMWNVLVFRALLFEYLQHNTKGSVKTPSVEKDFLLSLFGWFVYVVIVGSIVYWAVNTDSLPQDQDNSPVSQEEVVEIPQEEMIEDEPIETEEPEVVNPTPRIYQTTAQNVDGRIYKDFIMTFNMLTPYKKDNGQYPNALHELSNAYFPGEAPINSITGTSFFYQPIKQDGRNVGYTLCPEENSPGGQCFRLEFR